MEQLTRDVRFGLRMICASPGFTAAAILMLALGIGATTAIFSFVDAVLLKPLPNALLTSGRSLREPIVTESLR